MKRQSKIVSDINKIFLIQKFWHLLLTIIFLILGNKIWNDER